MVLVLTVHLCLLFGNQMEHSSLSWAVVMIQFASWSMPSGEEFRYKTLLNQIIIDFIF